MRTVTATPESTENAENSSPMTITAILYGIVISRHSARRSTPWRRRTDPSSSRVKKRDLPYPEDSSSEIIDANSFVVASVPSSAFPLNSSVWKRPPSGSNMTENVVSWLLLYSSTAHSTSAAMPPTAPSLTTSRVTPEIMPSAPYRMTSNS